MSGVCRNADGEMSVQENIRTGGIVYMGKCLSPSDKAEPLDSVEH